VYRILLEEGIDLPRYAVLNRDPDNPEGEFLLWEVWVFLYHYKSQIRSEI